MPKCCTNVCRTLLQPAKTSACNVCMGSSKNLRNWISYQNLPCQRRKSIDTDSSILGSTFAGCRRTTQFQHKRYYCSPVRSFAFNSVEEQGSNFDAVKDPFVSGIPGNRPQYPCFLRFGRRSQHQEC